MHERFASRWSNGQATLRIATAVALGGLLGLVTCSSVALAPVRAPRDAAQPPPLPFTPAANVFPIQETAMDPTLDSDQLVELIGNWSSEPRRDDVVVFNLMLQPVKVFAGRIIGVPDDTMEIRGGSVFVNGEPLAVPSIARQPQYFVPEQVVPPGGYLVLGDTHGASMNPGRFRPEARFHS